MSFNEHEIRTQWNADIERYSDFGHKVINEIKGLLKNISIHAETSFRVKEIDSLLKKMINKQYGYDRIHDKVGARIIVQFREDLTKLDEAINDHFGERIVGRDDKSESLDEYYFGYQSIHYDISNEEGMFCELQIRTICQHNWSMMSHHLSYKKDNIPVNIKRQINALSALFEVADTQFQSICNMINALPETSEIAIHNRLITCYKNLTSKEFSNQMTSYFLENLENFYLGEENISYLLEDFVKNNYSRLDEEINSINDNVFYSQPEIILILERLTNKKIFFKSKWIDLYPIELLENIALKWGMTIQ